MGKTKQNKACAGRDKDGDREHAAVLLITLCSNEIPKLNQGWILFMYFIRGGVVSSSDILGTFENLEMVRNKNWIWRCGEYG